jgi:intracellular sulfur oxidation DsrE/DsrF family protein
MKTISVLFAMLLMFSARAWSQSSKSENLHTGHHKVIMQITSGDTLAHKALMHQLKNLKEYWANAVSLEVLVQGPALDMVLSAKSTQREAIGKLKDSGIRIVACEFSMKQRNVKADELLPGLEMVPFGLVEIITRQEEGWTYLKAGF